MDTSNSMKWGMNNSTNQKNYTTNPNSRFYNQQKAVEDAVAKLKEKKNVNARFAVVSFDTEAGIETNWTNGTISYPSEVAQYDDSNEDAGGTNYQAGLRKADELLKNGRADATKIVVFLSDGDPTFYYDTNRKGQEKVYGSGSGYDETAMTKAQTQLGTMSMNYFYTVGVGPKDSYDHLSNLISSAPIGTVTGSYNGTDSSNLKNAFDSIIRDATELLCTEVTVTDTLTDEVELADQKLQVVVKDETGKVTLTVNGDVATAKLYNEGQLNDTKLSALPSTGGIGTTIFTIAGCVIMIAAAGLFFASRKKSDNK